MPGRLWAFSMWASDQSGPRERSSSRATTRSPSFRADRAPSRAMRGVRAGVQQVVVPEGAQGRVVGAVGPQRHAPRPLPLFEPQGVLLPGDLADEGLGIVGGDLAPDRLLVETSGPSGSRRPCLPPAPGRRARAPRWSRAGSPLPAECAPRSSAAVTASSTGRFLFRPSSSSQLMGFSFMACFLPLLGVPCVFDVLPVLTRPPLDDLGFLGGGLDADWEAVSLRQQQAVPPGTGQQPALEVLGKVEGVAHRADGGGVLLQEAA